MAPQVPMYGVGNTCKYNTAGLYSKSFGQKFLYCSAAIMLILGIIGYLLFGRFKPGIGALALGGIAGLF